MIDSSAHGCLHRLLCFVVLIFVFGVSLKGHFLKQNMVEVLRA